MNAVVFPAAKRALDDPFYYLSNFKRVLDWIDTRYVDLLEADELAFLQQFAQLPQSAQALLVRMVMRKGMLFRRSKLRYPEIDCIDTAIAALLAQGWVNRQSELDASQLFGLFIKTELTPLTRQAPANLARKDQLRDWAMATVSAAQSLAAWGLAIEDDVYQLQVDAFCERLRLMFFGNLRQDWSEFVLADLGIYSYEPVEISLQSRAFQTRQEVDLYLQLAQCREQLEEGAAPADILRELATLRSDNPWIERRRCKLVFQIAQQLERAGPLHEALRLYGECDYPGARHRAVRVLEKLGQPAAAWHLAEHALSAPESEAELQQLQRMQPRLHRALGLARPKVAPATAVKTLNLALAQIPGASVECVVRDHLSTTEAPVFYVENILLNGLFALLCWPAIFHPVPGAFFHPFHHSPADLNSPDFYPRRAEQFAACLAELDNGSYRQTILQRFAQKFGIQSSFVAWSWLDQSLLELALACIPATHLRSIFERILADIPANRAGLPDLIRFWPATRSYQLIEVKGPGDRLQDNQVRWLSHFAQHDIPVAVCYVTWAEGAQ
ncbi:VRR-NUC domain-containing protein [Silvimonas soli]|uniref:VRR-NUC domain-containing protein n=1 Tax=Silvimonas soli TaxID=2980100 RepID=UPI0024B3C057|nr:VRR-NUC domain-containing protein [Silvimonas soli]